MCIPLSMSICPACITFRRSWIRSSGDRKREQAFYERKKERKEGRKERREEEKRNYGMTRVSDFQRNQFTREFSI